MSGVGRGGQALQHRPAGQPEAEQEEVEEHPNSGPEDAHAGPTAISPDDGLFVNACSHPVRPREHLHVEGHS